MKGSDNAIYVGEGGSASYLEITGSGIDAGAKVIVTVKQNILDVTRCVLVDPQTLSGAAQSARAIEYIYAPMLEKADDLRAQYGDLGVTPLFVLVEKIARKLTGMKVILPDGKKGVYTLNLPPKSSGEKFKLGPGGYIRITWGPYFAPTETDKETAVRTITAAKTGGLLAKVTAVGQISSMYGIRDPQAELDQIKKDQDEDMASMMGDTGGGGGGANLDDTDRAAVPPPKVSVTKEVAGSKVRVTGAEPEEQTPPAGKGGKE